MDDEEIEEDVEGEGNEIDEDYEEGEEEDDVDEENEDIENEENINENNQISSHQVTKIQKMNIGEDGIFSFFFFPKKKANLNSYRINNRSNCKTNCII